MPVPRYLILVGFMGCGKSTLAKVLAQRLGATRLDSDALIESQQHSKITDIFAKHGEPYFRDLETELLRSLVTQHPGRSTQDAAPRTQHS